MISEVDDNNSNNSYKIVSSVYELDKDARITKLQSDIQYLVNILELAKGERTELINKNQILQTKLVEKEANYEEISELRILEEHSFRKTLLKERNLADQRITVKNNTLYDREMLLLNWVQSSMESLFKVDDPKIKKLVEATCDSFPKAAEIATKTYKATIIELQLKGIEFNSPQLNIKGIRFDNNEDNYDNDEFEESSINGGLKPKKGGKNKKKSVNKYKKISNLTTNESWLDEEQEFDNTNNDNCLNDNNESIVKEDMYGGNFVTNDAI